MKTETENEAKTAPKTEDVALDVPRLVMLRIRSLIADKEMVTATANRELQQFGEWQCDHQEHHREINQQIEELIKLYPVQSRSVQGTLDIL